MVCQRPERALFISTIMSKKKRSLEEGVNALNGLFSFLHIAETIRRTLDKNLCQRPERALFISTVKNVLKKALEMLVCQRPERALFISTKFLKLMPNDYVLCQRPERALFISTMQPVVQNTNGSGYVSTP